MKIEKGMPIPEKRKNRSKFADMEVGDSVLDTKTKTINQSVVFKVAGVYGKRSGKRFCSRVTDDGVRIWRVE
jgi:hypothetical protein